MKKLLVFSALLALLAGTALADEGRGTHTAFLEDAQQRY